MANLGTMAEMGSSGDTRYTWDRDNPAECEAAREHFGMMKSKGFLVFRVRWLGLRRGDPVTEFDPGIGSLSYVQDGPAEVARDFDAGADYVATPPAMGG